jgi:hypothetical protein
MRVGCPLTKLISREAYGAWSRPYTLSKRRLAARRLVVHTW